jgi:hypothetical protein
MVNVSLLQLQGESCRLCELAWHPRHHESCPHGEHNCISSAARVAELTVGCVASTPAPAPPGCQCRFFNWCSPKIWGYRLASNGIHDVHSICRLAGLALGDPHALLAGLGACRCCGGHQAPAAAACSCLLPIRKACAGNPCSTQSAGGDAVTLLRLLERSIALPLLLPDAHTSLAGSVVARATAVIASLPARAISTTRTVLSMLTAVLH